MLYVLFIQGRGQGCDYTIGCNQVIKVFTGPDDKEAAAAHAAGLVEDYSKERVASCRLFLVQEEIDVNAALLRREQARADEAKAEASREKEAAERKEYERLKAKFEKGG